MAANAQDVVSLLTDESFQRWLNGSAPETEISQWRLWLNASQNHAELHEEARALWQAGQFRAADLPDVEGELQKLQQRLSLPLVKNAFLRRLKPRHERSLITPRLRFGAMAIAAALLLALLGRDLFVPRPVPMQVVVTASGERKRLQLPEGSIIILNANSTLHHPKDWPHSSARNVELSGEAYFEVSTQTGPRRDFVVHTQDGIVKVVGTRFAVYERGTGTRVSVKEGEVAVANAERNAQVFLQAGEYVQFRKNDVELTPEVVALGFHTTWWQDHFKLENTLFNDVARRLEETYGVRVRVDDARLLSHRLSGAIENDSLEVIIAALAKALGTTVHRAGDVITFEN